MGTGKGKLGKARLSSPSSLIIELKNATDFNHQLQGIELYRGLEFGRKDEKFLNGDKGKHRKSLYKNAGKKSFFLWYFTEYAEITFG